MAIDLVFSAFHAVRNGTLSERLQRAVIAMDTTGHEIEYTEEIGPADTKAFKDYQKQYPDARIVARSERCEIKRNQCVVIAVRLEP